MIAMSGPATQLRDRARVQLSPGCDFAQHTGVGTNSFARLNFATTAEVLEKILKRIGTALPAA